MKRIVAVVFVLSAFVAQAQEYVCGKTQGDSMELTAASVYTATSPGFDLNTVPEVGAQSCFSDKPFSFLLHFQKEAIA